jgi:hypothetical protein
MADLDIRNAILALLIGAMVASFGLLLVTALDVAIAPPMDVVPLLVVNMTWSAIAFYLVGRDIWWGYVAAAVVGLSVAAFPLIVYFDILGPRPEIIAAHFVGVLSDFVIGIGLLVLGLRAIWPEPQQSVQEDFD